MKHIYRQLFAWINWKINLVFGGMGVDEDKEAVDGDANANAQRTFIGILDIFGKALMNGHAAAVRKTQKRSSGNSSTSCKGVSGEITNIYHIFSLAAVFLHENFQPSFNKTAEASTKARVQTQDCGDTQVEFSLQVKEENTKTFHLRSVFFITSIFDTFDFPAPALQS